MSVVYVRQSAWCIFTQPYFSVNLFRQAVREQTPGRTLLCLQQRSHTFSTIYSIQRCPSKDAGWERLVNMCTVNRLIFQHCQSSAAHHTHTHSHTSHAGTYGKPRVSEQRGFKAWPANTFICFFPPLCVCGSATDRRTHQHKHTLFNSYSFVLPTQFPSLRGSMSMSRDVTATTWRKKRNSW